MSGFRNIFGFLFFTLFIFIGEGFAQSVDKPLSDPTLEAKAREIMVGIRCLVCQNQSIEDSDAGLAQDLREIVREQVQQGKGEEEIHQYLIERYGDWVLMKPPFKSSTILLWFGPLIILLLGVFSLFLASKKRGRKPTPLTIEEKKELENILNQKGPK